MDCRTRLILPVLIGAVLTACTQSTSTSPPGSAIGQTPTAAPMEIGAPLYAAQSAEVIPLPEAVEQTVVIPNAVIRMDKKQTVAAEIDGKLEIIGYNLPPETIVDPNDRDILYDPNHAFNDPEGKFKKVPFKRLRIGDRVQKGQRVCLLNDLEALVAIEAAMKIKVASNKAIAEATTGAKKIEEVLEILNRVKEAQSAKEKLEGEATLARYRENIFQSERELAKADGDEKRAEVMRTKHRSTAAVTGIITNIMREPGEYVKAGEPLMEILSLEDVRIEGTMDAALAENVKPGMRVLIEPTLPIGPDLKIGAIGHRQPVTGVVVTHHAKPLIVSSSLDGTLAVWDPLGTKKQTRLVHPVGVQSVAATGPKTSQNLIASGGDDGRIRIWDVPGVENAPSKPASEFSESHTAPVTALAFSPDGRFLVSAAGREIWIWNVAEGKKLYALPGEHRDAVTTVCFTPQAKLMTASRDKTVRVWSIGDKGANVERTIDHRKANVDKLGVSSGGGRVLFDQEDNRLEVVSLDSGQPVGSIHNAGAGARFAQLALFSPDDQYVLTAGGDGDMRGELQVWAAPKSGGRGAEVRRLITPDRALPTCAAFGPSFVVVGNAAGRVNFWSYDQIKGAAQERVGRVISVMRADARNVKVRVETNALGGDSALLQDKSTATLIIRPGDAPAPMPIAPAPGSAALPPVVIPAGGIVVK